MNFFSMLSKTMGIVFILMLSLITNLYSQTDARRLPLEVYRDKMQAGWIGQIAGVTLGAPTENKFITSIVPLDKTPSWKPALINGGFGQDDLYVEMTFLKTLELYGLDVSNRQAGIDFANTRFGLWCANYAGRTNLRKGIAPPDSGHPQFSRNSNDIDYQIEADFAGLISPGMPNMAISLGDKFGHIMNYGEGVYAGQFVSGMYAEAFFETDVVKIVEAGLKCIPEQCQYAEMVRDMLAWYRADPNNWEKTWQLCEDKYSKNPEYQKESTGHVDCRINGAYIVMGLLYGKGDLDNTITISMRCGKDSDCNPSNAAGILFTSIGYKNLPSRFKEELDERRTFSNTEYNMKSLYNVCEKLAREAVIKEKGRIEKDANGKEVLIIPIAQPKLAKLKLTWAPNPIANSKFTPEEMAKIIVTGKPTKKLADDLAIFAPGWQINNCGPDADSGLRSENGRENVLVTYPAGNREPCVLSKSVTIAEGVKTTLNLTVGKSPKSEWNLIVIGGGKLLLNQQITDKTLVNGWQDISIDLTEFAGKTILLELHNRPPKWNKITSSHWAKIEIEQK